MATITRAQLVSLTREYMDAVGSQRWSDALIQTVNNSVFDSEWSNILNAAPYWTFQSLTLTADTLGQIALSSLSTGTADAQKNWYRIIAITDGNTVYREMRFQDAPLAATSNQTAPSYSRQYYLTGDALQLLPSGSGTVVTVSVNWKPTAVLDLVDDASVLNFPANNATILAAESAYQLLLRGGAETAAANTYKRLASEEREVMLDDIRRRTINPTRMAYPDSPTDWGV